MKVTKEFRFAVVMYGGISLAVYINGIAQELLTLVRSTSKDRRQPTDPPGVSKLVGVYRDVATKLSRKEDPQWDSSSEPCVRFVVDVITGASAGGINGIFLAKALSNNQQLSKLRDLWIQEADLGLLLNDKRAVKELSNTLQPQMPPRALLSGPRLYLKLREAFNLMGSDPVGSPHYSDLGELDLFVTATDAWGEVLPLRLFDKFVWERRYKSVFHFRYRDPDARSDKLCQSAAEKQERRNDFVADNNDFLAFAARCTSSFPFAFEPIKLNDLNTWLASTGGPNKDSMEEWKRLFFEHPTKPQTNEAQWVEPEQRVYVDGGCLDNKPFGYVTRALQERSSDVAVERKLLYVEPAPDHPERAIAQRDANGVIAPDAIENAVRALMVMPLDETIREDLETILERNRDIDRLRRLLQEVDSDILSPEVHSGRAALILKAQQKWDSHAGISQTTQAATDWASHGFRSIRIDREETAPVTDVRYRGYSRLKLAAVTDELALVICEIRGLRRSSHEYFAVRCLVKKWRDLNYNDEGTSGGRTPAHFLLRFDFAYRMRRLEFLLRRIDRLSLLAAQAGGPDVQSERKALNFLLQSVLPGCPVWPDGWDIGMFQDFRNVLAALRDHASCALQILRVGVQNLRTPAEKIPRNSREHIQWQRRNEVAQAIESIPIDASILYKTLGAENDSERPIEVSFTFNEDQILDRAGEALKDPRFQTALNNLDVVLNGVLLTLYNNALQEIAEGFDLNTSALTNSIPKIAATRLMRYYYDFFDDYDSILYPISYGTHLGEGARIDIIRISPDDATSIIDESEAHTQKLAGVKLGHFGAFLDEVWRRNDILWGRLDAAERIIESLLLGVVDPNAPKTSKGQDQEIAGLIVRAHQAIIEEELGNEGLAEIQKLFVEAVIQMGASKINSREEMTATVQEILNATNGRTSRVLQAALLPEDLLKCMKNYRVNPIPNRETTLESACRAATVMGNMFQDLSTRHNLPSHWTRWLAWGGTAMWSLVEISAPRKLTHWFARYWFALAALICVTLIGVGAAFGEPVAQKFGLKLLLLTVVTYSAVLLISSLLVSASNRTSLKAAVKNGKTLFKFILYVSLGLVLLWIVLMGFNEAVHILEDGGISGLWGSFKAWIGGIWNAR